MRVISKEFRKTLKKSEIYNLFAKARKPDHAELDRAVEHFEKWIAKEHAKDRRLLMEASGK